MTTFIQAHQSMTTRLTHITTFIHALHPFRRESFFLGGKTRKLGDTLPLHFEWIEPYDHTQTQIHTHTNTDAHRLVTEESLNKLTKHTHVYMYCVRGFSV